METAKEVAKSTREQVRNSVRLIRRCTKPDQKGVGVCVMGFTAYVVKLVHIPIIRLIVG